MKNPYREFSKVSPQREKGNRQIANDVYDALIEMKLSGTEYQIVLFIIKKTWGFCKHSDVISYSQMTKITGATRQGIIKTVKKLEQKKIIVISKKVVNHSLPVNEYLFNKHYDTWLKESSQPQFTSSKVVNPSSPVNHSLPVSPPKLVNHSSATGKPQLQKVVNHSLHTKEIFTKETIQKKTSYVANQNHLRLVILLKNLILQNDPKAKVPKDITKWVDPIDKLERLDHRSIEEIEVVIRWCQADDFWHSNILSTKKLREKFPQLLLQAKRNAGGLSGKMKRTLQTIMDVKLTGGEE